MYPISCTARIATPHPIHSAPVLQLYACLHNHTSCRERRGARSHFALPFPAQASHCDPTLPRIGGARPTILQHGTQHTQSWPRCGAYHRSNIASTAHSQSRSSTSLRAGGAALPSEDSSAFAKPEGPSLLVCSVSSPPGVLASVEIFAPGLTVSSSMLMSSCPGLPACPSAAATMSSADGAPDGLLLCEPDDSRGGEAFDSVSP